MTFPSIPLKRIARFTAGGTPSVGEPTNWSDGDEGHPWVAIGDMSSVDSVMTTARRISDYGLHSARIGLGKPGTILFSMYASLGHTAWLGVSATWNQAILGIQPDQTTDARFLRYSLASLRPNLLEQARSNTQANLNAEQVGNLLIPRPPLDEQRRIANFLDSETARIDKVRALQAEVRSAAKARLVAQLDLEMDELSERHGTRPFRRMIHSIEQGTSPQCDNFPATPGKWGVLKVSAVKNGVFVEDENKQLPTEVKSESRYEVRPGDLLITRANTPQLVGAAAVAVSPRKKLLICDKIFRVSITSDLMANFLVFVSLSTKIRDMCAEASHGTSQSMANLKTEEIKRWPIPNVPLSIQSKVVADLSAARTQVASLTEAIDSQLSLLTERRQALIMAAVTGQIDVTTARSSVPSGDVTA
ncbi:type I restriction enzyme, S subunit [Frankia sp. Hr75.2]|nr:type I restriction enzyme, S subunit [Frankia sp. Hr75.2]